MVKLQKWEKEIILQKYKTSQQEKRRVIVRVLQEQVKILTQGFDQDIKELNIAKHNILVTYKLAGLNDSTYGCNTEEKHPELIKHDTTTDKGIIRIIREE